MRLRLRDRSVRQISQRVQSVQTGALKVRSLFEKRPPAVAILMVNGFDRRGRWGQFNEEEARSFPWVDLSLDQVEKLSKFGPSYEVILWDNTGLSSHRDLIKKRPVVRFYGIDDEQPEMRHGQALDWLATKVDPETEYIVALDTDAFPIRAGWLANLIGRLESGASLAGVWRDEMEPRKTAFVHPSCLAIRRSTLEELNIGFTMGRRGIDVASRLTTAIEKRGERVSKLRRTNAWDPHFLMGAIYGDLIYHQGAGSRGAKFDTASDRVSDESLRQSLRDLAFSDLPTLVGVLSGDLPPDAAPTLAPR